MGKRSARDQSYSAATGHTSWAAINGSFYGAEWVIYNISFSFFRRIFENWMFEFGNALIFDETRGISSFPKLNCGVNLIEIMKFLDQKYEHAFCDTDSILWSMTFG